MTNHRLDGQLLQELVALDPEGTRLIKRCMDHFGFSARTYTRLLRMGRTLADLDGREAVSAEDIAQAISFRRAGSEAQEWLTQ